METKSPSVNFNVINNNVYPAQVLGISHVVAVTEKGPVGEADTIIRTVRQFREIYGSETVPDGSISNIEIALSLGSSLRISRVDTESGDAATSDSWIKALDVFKNYNDSYQLICSHVHQHISPDPDGEELGKVHIAAAKLATSSKEVVYYIEVPKYKSETTPNDNTNMVTWKQTLAEKVGASASVAYFGGGIKLYNEERELKDCDVLGAVMGLGDASAKNYGPWYQFSGMNRGIVSNAYGITIPNYGSPGNYEELDKLAKASINVFVIKDTRLQGKKTMLWHNFTDNTEVSNSEIFLGVERLILYLKKTLRPILESYLEEPNTFSTWSNIYYTVKPELDALVDNKAITEYTWYGDQDATSYDELTVNTEADVRAGKYKAELHFKEVIGMQDITINLVIDATSSSVEIG